MQVGNIFLFGPERNLLAYLHSMEKLLLYIDHFDWVYPSHSQFPVKSNVIYGLIDGVKKILSGEIQGEPTFYETTPIKIYDIGVAKNLYEYESVLIE